MLMATRSPRQAGVPGGLAQVVLQPVQTTVPPG